MSTDPAFTAERLDPSNLDEAIAVGELCFAHERLPLMSIWLRLSVACSQLERDAHRSGVAPGTDAWRRLRTQYLDWRQRLLLALAGVSSLRYWLLREAGSRAPVAVAGLYTRRRDRARVVWGGWMGVHPNHRHRGLGGELVSAGIDMARALGHHAVRLYTTNHPAEAAARRLYAKHGFRETGRRRYWHLGVLPTRYARCELEAQVGIPDRRLA